MTTRECARRAGPALLLAMAAACAAVAGPGQHDGDIIVGQNAAGQLVIGGFAVDYQVIELAFQDGQLGPGWFASDPGFDAFRSDPLPDFLPMTPGASIYLRAVTLDPAVAVVRFVAGQGFVFVDDDGDRLPLGGSDLHTHPIWMVDQDDPDYVAQRVYYGTFVLEDDNGLHATSEPFTLHFSYEPPCPGDIDADRETGFSDLVVLLAGYGTCESDPDWAWYANIDPTPDPDSGEQCVNFADLVLLLGSYGCGQ